MAPGLTVMGKYFYPQGRDISKGGDCPRCGGATAQESRCRRDKVGTPADPNTLKRWKS